jgi:predicted transcriptional regulator
LWFRPEDQKIVGSVLADARNTAALTQVELARKLKKPQSFVSAYEGGQRRLDILEFLAITKMLGANGRKLFAKIEKSAR